MTQPSPDGQAAPEQGEGQVTEALSDQYGGSPLTEGDIQEYARWILVHVPEIEADYPNAVDRLLAERTQDKERIGGLVSALLEAHHNPQPIDWKSHDESACEVCALLAPPGQERGEEGQDGK